MTRVGFYVVQSAEAQRQLSVAVRLADKAFQRGHKIFINAVDEHQARELGELLWTHRPSSFLPHSMADAEQAESIVIGWGQEPVDHHDLLINLQLSVPAFFSRFQRVAEVVTQDSQHLEAQRLSWRFYRERGYQLEKHDI
ncbi:MAG: DNA polymerase III subunit chi [Pseudomonadota bacterium]